MDLLASAAPSPSLSWTSLSTSTTSWFSGIVRGRSAAASVNRKKQFRGVMFKSKECPRKNAMERDDRWKNARWKNGTVKNSLGKTVGYALSLPRSHLLPISSLSPLSYSIHTEHCGKPDGIFGGICCGSFGGRFDLNAPSPENHGGTHNLGTLNQ